MTQVSQETMMFKRNNENKEVAQVISEVCKALEAKGYNPIDQLVGYLLSGDPTYITSHDDAAPSCAVLNAMNLSKSW